MIREIKNWWGKHKGYGGCYICGDTWDWKESQDIPYSNSSGMFPLCKLCFAEQDEKDILYWCKILLEKNTCACKLEKYARRLTKEIKKIKGGKI